MEKMDNTLLPSAKERWECLSTHAHTYVPLWLLRVTASLGPLWHASLCSLGRLAFALATECTRLPSGAWPRVGVASPRWVGPDSR